MDTHNSTPNDENNNENQRRTCRRLTERSVARIVGAVVSGLVLACVIAFFFGFLVKWLWGVTLTPLFDIAQPTYWQTVGLIILAKVFFGGVGHHHKRTDHPFRRASRYSRFHKPSGTPMDFFHSHHRRDFREYWEKEGREAFEDYLSKRKRPDTRDVP